MLILAIEQLLKGFDDDSGVNEDIYKATYDLLCMVYGNQAGIYFSNSVKCTESRYYLCEKPTYRELFVDIVNSSL